MKKFVVLLMSLVMVASISTKASAAGTCTWTHWYPLAYGYCNANYVNVRTGWGLDYPSVGYAFNGDEYYYYATYEEPWDTEWLHVHGLSNVHERHIGWMYYTYFTATDPAGYGGDVA